MSAATMPTPEFILGLLLCAVGIAGVLFRSTIARMVVQEQNRFWGFRLAKRGITISEIVLVIWGAALIAFGVLLMLDLIKMK
jgi:hypothetical protein